MTGFRGLDGGLKSHAIAHFADEDDVGIFAHHGADAVLVGVAVEANLALVDEGFFVGVGEFDGVFDGDDVDVFGVVDLFDHGGDGGGFSGAGNARHDDEALLAVGDFGEDVGQAEVGIVRDFGVDAAGNDAAGAALAEDVDAKAFDAAHGVGEIDGAVLVVLGELLGVEHLFDHPLDFVGREGFGLERAKFAADADARDCIRLDVDVGAVHRREGFEEGIDAVFFRGVVRRERGCRVISSIVVLVSSDMIHLPIFGVFDYKTRHVQGMPTLVQRQDKKF